jgi:hypothetical protein
MKKAITAITIFILATLLISGCLGIKAPLVSRPEAPAILIDYQRTGGIANLNDRLVIFTNGAGLISGKNVNREISFNQSDLKRIDELFSNAHFSQFEPSYTSRRGGADLIKYTLSYNNMTVTTEDAAIPPELQPVVDAMNQIMTDKIAHEQTVQFPGNITE